MNKQEATKLLALIRIAYPTAYRDMDEASKKATVRMWAMSFPDVPLEIMEMAFNHFIRVSKYPPTVAEMVQELRRIYYGAMDGVANRIAIGDMDGAEQCMAIMDCVASYKDDACLSRPVASGRLDGIGGIHNAELPGAPGDWVDRENGIPFLGSGNGRGTL